MSLPLLFLYPHAFPTNSRWANCDSVMHASTILVQELSDVRFCVFGMGDRSYADSFCEAAKKIEQRMLELGSLVRFVCCNRVFWFVALAFRHIFKISITYCTMKSTHSLSSVLISIVNLNLKEFEEEKVTSHSVCSPTVSIWACLKCTPDSETVDKSCIQRSSWPWNTSFVYAIAAIMFKSFHMHEQRAM